MPQHEEDLVRFTGIFYGKREGGLKTAFPAMPGNGDALFIKVNRGTGNKQDAAEKQDIRSMQQFFQAADFLQK